MFKQMSRMAVVALITSALSVMATDAQAGYSTYGLGMDVQTGTVANGALHVQLANNLWSGTAGSSSPTNTYTNSFSGLDSDNYAKAWLVTTIYGGSNLNTAKITATVNGHTVADPTVGNAGGVNDANSGVYGSSVAGIWVLSLPVDPSYLNKGSATTNQVNVVVSDKTTGATSPFDGRSYYQSLITITQSASLNNTLAYAFAAGGGDIGTSSGYVTSRTLNMGGLSAQPITQADLYAIYLYGDAGSSQKDAILLNGASLLGDDVANKNGSAAYPADFVHAAIPSSGLYATDNLLKFTVDPADFSSGTPESSLRPQMAVLGVSQSVPEPASLSVLALGAGLLLSRSRHRR